MKKALCILISIILTFSIASAKEQERKVLPTDIVAYVDGVAINSYNIDGWTGIVAEDLSAYGFSVIWNPELRTLEVGDRDGIASNTTAFKPQKGEYKVYETDIKTYVNGSEVTSFNIGGYTVIFIDTLMCYGDVVWNPTARTISFTYRQPWSVNLTGDNHIHDNTCNSDLELIDAEFVRNADGTFSAKGEGLNHLSWMRLSYNKRYGGMRIGFYMVATHLISDNDFVSFLSSVVNTNYDGQTINADIERINSQANVTINGKDVRINEVVLEKGNNHQDYYFVLDCDLQEEEIEKVTFRLVK